MNAVDIATGEIVKFDAAAAARRAERIVLRLDAIADNYALVMPLIRESIAQRDDLALGYRSPGEYVADRFGGSLQRLGVEVRRAVVGELTAAGLSTRAIAPVVGTSHMSVKRDLDAAVTGVTAAPHSSGAGVNVTDSGSCVSDVGSKAGTSVDDSNTSALPAPAPEPRPVVGIDGKTYTRPTPKPVAASIDSAADAITEFPDLAYYSDDERHLLDLANALRDYRANGELDARLDTLRKSIAYEKSIEDGTFVSPFVTVTCPTCGNETKELRK